MVHARGAAACAVLIRHLCQGCKLRVRIDNDAQTDTGADVSCSNLCCRSSASFLSRKTSAPSTHLGMSTARLRSARRNGWSYMQISNRPPTAFKHARCQGGTHQ